ncbi:HNH endonuclease signature motif containing protein [Agromyces sp. Marseille-P2726]|uniref:HNH endonuclease signature motif containing protein n=1 Tax=Agromyces sp. Marseille-P2726 TaxID=2709132 RepID=UPI00156D8806|nr:HNH endonuclease signature motif containing protein [Agromyces sp. Marseille-P2726]
MTELPEALEPVRSALLELFEFDAARDWSDDELLVAMAAVESIGRVVDAQRATIAGEVADRSRVELGSERLSTRMGCRSASELIERVTQVSGAEARRRVALGSATRPQAGLGADSYDARFPQIGAALAAGEIGADAAATIIRELDRTRRVADPARLAVAEGELLDSAIGAGVGAPVRCTADELRVQAQAWAMFLDQDGPEPDDERAMRRRGFRVGRARDGLVAVSGELLPEVAAALTRLFDAHLAPRSGGGFMTAEERAKLEVQAETRTSDQQRHDVVASIIATAARSAEQPTIGGAAPPLLVGVRASHPPSGHGAPHADGVQIPVSLRAARHLMCTGGIQTVVVDDRGAILQLGSPERCFTAHQRRAILLRDGGCLIPGCSVPASWCEIHHVVPDVDGGPTHPDNGVMLCFFHHRTIDTSGWKIRMVRGSPHIRPPAWLDPGGRWWPATKSPTRLADRLESGPARGVQCNEPAA